MPNDMVRFAVVRPFQKKDVTNTRTKVIPSDAPTHNSAFFQGLKQAKGANDRTAMIERARKYRLEDAQFVKVIAALKAPIAKFDSFLISHERSATVQQLTAEVESLFQAAGIANWKAWLAGPDFKLERGRLHDALIACSIGAEDDAAARLLRPHLVRAIRLTHLLQELASGARALAAKDGLSAILAAVVMLPGELFPLPLASSADARAETLERDEAERKKLESRRDAAIASLREVERLTTAKIELGRLHAEISQPERLRERDARLVALEAGQGASRPLLARLTGGNDTASDFQAKHFTDRSTEWVLTGEAESKLSGDSVAALQHIGAYRKGSVDVRRATADIEARIAAISDKLHRATPKHASVRIGSNFVSKAVLAQPAMKDILLAQPASGAFDISVPLPPPPLATAPTVPTGRGDLRPLGFADLLVVQEEIQRYEAGEVAHIENVLKGESKKREHKRTTEREQILFAETERTTESERDLQTTDRFSLQTTAQKEIEQKIKIEAGVEATYNGAAFEIKADAGFAYERATKESSSKATSVAHDVTDRTVSRLRETVREQRTTRTREIIEETNLHEIVNSNDPDGHIIGVYRWVNAVHKAEVANYGRRLMFEVIVPEPAAFFRHAEQSTPVEGVTLEKPEPPVYQATPMNPDGSFAMNLDFSETETRPLQPEELNTANYLHWVAKYNVQDVLPPPPEFKTIGLAVSEKPASSDNLVPQAVGDLTVEAGYKAVSAWVNSTSIHHPGGYLRVGVGTANTNLWGGSPDLRLNGEDSKLPVTVCFYKIAALALTVEVTCQRSDEHYRTWQLKTYASIITAYNLLKSTYDEQLAAAQIQAGVAIAGRNPLKNRDIERAELKRAALSVITGQHFDLFDAMREGVGPSAYPQMDLLESAAEGRYIQFFEQAFEWPAISYIFYPYFWGRKDRWIADLHLEDPDPKFEKFLQAGAARVLIPVRPGYEHAVLHYLETAAGEIWEGGDPPHVDDPLYVSIVDAIKEDQGNWTVAGRGALAVKQNDPVVLGMGTAFTEEDDENRELVIRGEKYRIGQVEGLDRIRLDRPYERNDESDVPYELGLRYVGEPWEVTVPTSLVWLQTGPELPDFTQA
jgi:hypothetical protein